MFDVGFWELLIIAVVALLVLGPERLPEVAKQAAFFVRKARQVHPLESAASPLLHHASASPASQTSCNSTTPVSWIVPSLC